jgi:hypothetical protein
MLFKLGCYTDNYYYYVMVMFISIQNWEFEIYNNNRSNSFVQDGKLYLRPTLTADKYDEDFLSSGVLNLHGGAPADV